ncbi:hypothetical protein ACSFC1_10095 [Pseudothermotoga sp. U03pept]|uniref:hypothetical protein n=1 Tax=Pseudothermotoga sp. U03pept TaxID=3447012 RepID=UPI003F102292
MLEYLIAKARIDELLREAESERMLNQVKKEIKVLKGSNVEKEESKKEKKHSKVHV